MQHEKKKKVRAARAVGNIVIAPFKLSSRLSLLVFLIHSLIKVDMNSKQIRFYLKKKEN